MSVRHLLPFFSKRGTLVLILGAILLGGGFCADSFLRSGGLLFGEGGGIPHVSFVEPPVLDADRRLRISYDAWDLLGIREVSLRLKLLAPLPGMSAAHVDIALPIAEARRIFRTDVWDPVSHPWAGQDVLLQLVVTNFADKARVTEPVVVTLPERRFSHPLARLLIEERAKLMQNPEDILLREEAASTMASIAYKPMSYRGDPVVLLALRSGAVRLLLEDDRASAVSVNDLLWRAATRIEAGNPVLSQRAM